MDLATEPESVREAYGASPGKLIEGIIHRDIKPSNILVTLASGLARLRQPRILLE